MVRRNVVVSDRFFLPARVSLIREIDFEEFSNILKDADTIKYRFDNMSLLVDFLNSAEISLAENDVSYLEINPYTNEEIRKSLNIYITYDDGYHFYLMWNFAVPIDKMI